MNAAISTVTATAISARKNLAIQGQHYVGAFVRLALLSDLSRGLKLALKPADHSLRFQRIRPVAAKTLERATSLSIGR